MHGDAWMILQEGAEVFRRQDQRVDGFQGDRGRGMWLTVESRELTEQIPRLPYREQSFFAVFREEGGLHSSFRYHHDAPGRVPLVEHGHVAPVIARPATLL
jgi:hypothetical protein